MAERYDEQLILGFLEDDLEPEQHLRFQQMLVEDARLRNLVAQLTQDRSLLRQLQREPPPADLMEPVNQLLERQMLLSFDDAAREANGAAAVLRSQRLFKYGALAAVLLIGVCLALVISANFPPESGDSVVAFDVGRIAQPEALPAVPGPEIAADADPAPATVGEAVLKKPKKPAKPAKPARSTNPDEQTLAMDGLRDDAAGTKANVGYMLPKVIGRATVPEQVALMDSVSGKTISELKVEMALDEAVVAPATGIETPLNGILTDATSPRPTVGVTSTLVSKPQPPTTRMAHVEEEAMPADAVEREIPLPLTAVDRTTPTSASDVILYRLDVSTDNLLVSETSLLVHARKERIEIIPAEPAADSGVSGEASRLRPTSSFLLRLRGAQIVPLIEALDAPPQQSAHLVTLEGRVRAVKKRQAVSTAKPEIEPPVVAEADTALRGAGAEEEKAEGKPVVSAPVGDVAAAGRDGAPTPSPGTVRIRVVLAQSNGGRAASLAPVTEHSDASVESDPPQAEQPSESTDP
ncbi:MAG: hypothetical protein CMJ18_06770 [Phycisphaeraceae bacterium]|nr:hypothetical protein [Phycisphaeraceae bacterium]